MHVYEVIPGIYKFISKIMLFKTYSTDLVTSENSKMKLVTSVQWLIFISFYFAIIIHEQYKGHRVKAKVI